MDISKLKEVVGRLGVIRDYSSLLVPVAIVLAAVLVFVPGQLMSRGLKGRMERESISKRAKKIMSLSRDTVASDQWEVERVYQRAYENDANRIAFLAARSSQRELLSYKIFPEPKDTSPLIFGEFGQRFRSGIDGLMVRINALDCPTKAELDRSLQTSEAVGLGRSAGGSRIYSAPSVVSDAIKDELCRAKAESAFVYANVSDLSGYDYWSEYEYTGITESVEDCWYWQLAYWVIEDVISTVSACNAGSDSVYTSPVKRIISASFVTADQRVGKGAEDSRPEYVRSVSDGLTNPCTGRISNDDIDVLHFDIVVLVSSKAVLPFMQKLCSRKSHKFGGWLGQEPPQTFMHNQVTILASNISSIDRDDSMHDLYRYGEDAVVRLDLICEYIFNKSGYDQIKPKCIKEAAIAATAEMF